MVKILLHPQTKVDLQACLTAQPHAIMLTGAKGMGKYFTALWLAAQLANVVEIENYAYFLHIQPEKDNIGIEKIRDLQSFLRLKTTGAREGIRRIVIIEDAQTMTIEAQNALLKNLEEPPADTAIVLTAVPSRTILSTIYSRVQQISIKPPSLAYAKLFYTDSEAAEIEKAYTLSDGMPGVMGMLLSKDSGHLLLQYVELAKQLLRQSSFERLVHISELTSDKAALRQLLAALKQVATAGLKQAGLGEKTLEAKRWHQILAESQRAEKRLELSVNTKLLLTDLLLNM